MYLSDRNGGILSKVKVDTDATPAALVDTETADKDGIVDAELVKD
ncbi:hypothetical protein [Streptomyces sp. SID8352]|nr:hypothetical protein [Streptomyces sp. SID8352]